MTLDPDQCILLPEQQRGEQVSQRPEEERAVRPRPPALPLTSLIIEFSSRAHQQALITKKRAPPDSVFARMKPPAESVAPAPASGTRTSTSRVGSGRPAPQGHPGPPGASHVPTQAVWLLELLCLLVQPWGRARLPERCSHCRARPPKRPQVKAHFPDSP